MKHRTLVIMCGGLSSRLKNSLSKSKQSVEKKRLGLQYHKSLLPLGNRQHPLLYYSLRNAQQAKVSSVYLITGEATEGFDLFLAKYAQQPVVASLTIECIPQRIPSGRTKPLGTADAIRQALEQKRELMNRSFIVINGDNLYSANALNALYALPEKQQALIGYHREALRYPVERLRQFSLLEFTTQNNLKRIVEKPTAEVVARLEKSQANILVSMNVFKFFGASIYPHVKNCPLDRQRNEKELPQAVQLHIEQKAGSFTVLPFSEHVPDLTSLADLDTLNQFIEC